MATDIVLYTPFEKLVVKILADTCELEDYDENMRFHDFYDKYGDFLFEILEEENIFGETIVTFEKKLEIKKVMLRMFADTQTPYSPAFVFSDHKKDDDHAIFTYLLNLVVATVNQQEKNHDKSGDFMFYGGILTWMLIFGGIVWYKNK